MNRRRIYATTSALLKLLRLRRTLRKPGRSLFDAGSMTWLAFAVIHASSLPASLPAFILAAVVTSFKECAVVWWAGRLGADTNVGRREGVVGVRRPVGAGVLLRGGWPFARRGILLGGCIELPPFVGTVVVVTADVPDRLIFAAPAVDRVTRVGRDSLFVTP